MAEQPDPLAHNESEYDDDPTAETWFDPWKAIGLSCMSYNSIIDRQAIEVLRGIRDKLYCDDISERYGMHPAHVELFQCMFSSMNWCDYGTSPRGCSFAYDYGDDFGARLIAAWEAYYLRTWGEPVEDAASKEG